MGEKERRLDQSQTKAADARDIATLARRIPERTTDDAIRADAERIVRLARDLDN